MKLTEKEVREAIDIKNMVKCYLDFSERDELVARLKKAGLIEGEKFVVVFEDLGKEHDPYIYRYTFYNTFYERLDKCENWDVLKSSGAMTMEEIKAINPYFENFAIKVN